MERLNLDNNEISEIKRDSFLFLSNLKCLCLSNNKLKIIDSNIFRGLIELERLFLDNNEINEILNGNFFYSELSKLKELSLFNNKLKHIHPEILRFTSLVDIWISRNKQMKTDWITFKELENIENQ